MSIPSQPIQDNQAQAQAQAQAAPQVERNTYGFSYNPHGLSAEEITTSEAAMTALDESMHSSSGQRGFLLKSLWKCIKNRSLNILKYINQAKAESRFEQFVKKLQILRPLAGNVERSENSDLDLQFVQSVIETTVQKTFIDFVDQKTRAEEAIRSNAGDKQEKVRDIELLVGKEVNLYKELQTIIEIVEDKDHERSANDPRTHLYNRLVSLRNVSEAIIRTHTRELDKIVGKEELEAEKARIQAELELQEGQEGQEVQVEEPALPPVPLLEQATREALTTIESRRFSTGISSSALKVAAKNLGHPTKMKHYNPNLKQNDYKSVSKEVEFLNNVEINDLGNANQIENWKFFYAKMCVVNIEIHAGKLEGLFNHPNFINVLEKGVRLFDEMAASQDPHAKKIADGLKDVSDKYHCYQLSKNPEGYKAVFQSKHTDFIKLRSILLENVNENQEKSHSKATKDIVSNLAKINSLIKGNSDKYKSLLEKLNNKSNGEMVASWFKADSEMKLIQGMFSEIVGSTVDHSLTEIVRIFDDINHPSSELGEGFLKVYEEIRDILQCLPNNRENTARKACNEGFKMNKLAKKGIKQLPNLLPNFLREFNGFLSNTNRVIPGALGRYGKNKREVTDACRSLQAILEACQHLCAEEGAMDGNAIHGIAGAFSGQIANIATLLRMKHAEEHTPNMTPEKYRKNDFRVGEEGEAAPTPSRVYFPQVLMRIVMLTKELKGHLVKQREVNQPVVNSLQQLILFFNVHIRHSIRPYGEDPTASSGGIAAPETLSPDLLEYLTPEGAIKPQFLNPDGSVKAWEQFVQAMQAE